MKNALHKRQVLEEVVKEALGRLSEDKLVEVFDFVGYLLAREKREEKAEELELDPKKDPILKYIGGVSVEPFAHKIDEILYGEED
jgi:chaperonin cofactor prefoldin